ncbi:unnamed protein product [Rhizophagus irregularis]|nr:unnamed protein product [Rhizophagus irregularis]CAB5368933.1 unnamed protein product [Rhizophagus irregularis]
MNEHKFFHYAPNYDKFYHITCQIILQGSDFFDDHNYDHGFSLIANMLNRKTYGIDIGINNSERKEVVSLHQKLNLEQDLERILPFHLTQHHTSNRELRMNSNRNLNSPYGYNTQTISIGDNQTNFDNSFSKPIEVGYYTNNVTSLTTSQGNNFLQSINPFSTSAAPQNRVIHNVTTNSQQQTDFNNISQHITDREMGSFHGSIVNNTPVTQSVLTTDINHGNDSQNVNRTRNFAYTWQQVDLNNNCRDTDLYGGNIRNNVMTTQANGLTYDYQDINDIHQSQQQVDFNNNYGNSYNENIENNVTTSQANGSTCDHQNTNDIHQVNHINNNYRGTDSHNENIENNVTTTQANDLTCDHQDRYK